MLAHSVPPLLCPPVADACCHDMAITACDDVTMGRTGIDSPALGELSRGSQGSWRCGARQDGCVTPALLTLFAVMEHCRIKCVVSAAYSCCEPQHASLSRLHSPEALPRGPPYCFSRA